MSETAPDHRPVEMSWSGWGDPAKAHPLPESARGLVDLVLGTSDTPPVAPEDVRLAPALDDALLAGLAGIVGEDHVHTDHTTRLLRTRGKSTPDLLRPREGDGSDAPGAVVRPADHDEVQQLLAWCTEQRVAVVPFGGGTSVVGGLVADRDGFAGVVSLDLVRLDGLLEVDPVSMTATLQAGVRGPRAEDLLAEHGLTLGHFPQSFRHASIGGFAVTRSSGQSSAGYGRFDAMVVGLRAATPIGPLELGVSPSNAVGPDLREWVMGSEGAFGVVTSVTLRVRPAPAMKVYETWRFADLDAGTAAMRRLAQAGPLPTVLRLSDEAETAINLADPESVGQEGAGGCLMVVGFEGEPDVVAAAREGATAALADAGGTSLGEAGGQAWAEGRFEGPHLRDAMLDVGVLVETLETVTFWSRLRSTYDAVKAALEASLGADGSPVIVLCHVSHVYATGASLYFTVAGRRGDEPVERWLTAKRAASDAMVEHGASITHHHAVGRDHRPWLEAEVGPVGIEMLRAVKERLDPAGILNPGVLVDRVR